MKLDISHQMISSLARHLDGLDKKTFTIVVDALADIGLLVTPSAGGFTFETLLDRAKRLVIEELMKIGRNGE